MSSIYRQIEKKQRLNIVCLCVVDDDGDHDGYIIAHGVQCDYTRNKDISTLTRCVIFFSFLTSTYRQMQLGENITRARARIHFGW